MAGDPTKKSPHRVRPSSFPSFPDNRDAVTETEGREASREDKATLLHGVENRTTRQREIGYTTRHRVGRGVFG